MSSSTATGAYNLNLSVTTNTLAAATASDDNSAFATASNVGEIGSDGETISAAITPQTQVLLPPNSGGVDQPGHRDIPDFFNENYVGAEDRLRVRWQYSGDRLFLWRRLWISEWPGTSIMRLPLSKNSSRDIFQIYSSIMGVECVETANQRHSGYYG